VVGVLGRLSSRIQLPKAGEEYNSSGKVCKATDPLGRETRYTYGTNNVADAVCTSGSSIDLLKVEQKNGAGYDLVASYTYNSQHRPLTITDAAGQTMTATYNAQGQIATVTTPPRAGITENRTTTLTYDTNGYLQGAAGPSSGATLGATYDSYGRVRTLTDQAGYTLTYDYDGLDRTTKVTHPDGTYEQIVYNRLDAEQRRDRLGRWTHTFFDALRRPVAMRDPLGRTTTQQWCNCGSLDKVIDASGNATAWERDLQARVKKETRADGSFTQFVYENTTSRLSQRIDRKNQTATYTYFADDRLQQVVYTNAQIPTPTVSYTYDSVYPLKATMTDGTGTTTWSYNPISSPPNLGAGSLASISGPVGGSTYSTTFSYDELGRVVGRSINGASVSDSLDVLGRVATETDPLGTFNYTYVGATRRVNTTSFPNGQTTSYLYFDNLGDNRLQQIKHLDPAAAVLSKFDYTYDAVGTIKTWSQQAGTSPTKVYNFEYDNARQLTSGVVSGVSPLPVPSRFGYAYDSAGNRIAEQLDDAVTGATYNNLTQLVSTQAGGSLIFRGSVNEPATVTVGAKPAQVAVDNTFQGTAAVPSGTSNVVVAATDPSGNMRTNTYQLSQSGVPKTLTYDLDGNLTNDGTRTYEWDAENRLIAVNQGTHRSEFTYDGLGQRVRIVEKDNGTPTSDKRYVWCGIKPCQERDASGVTVTKAFYRHGIMDGSTKYFTTVDHLGSTREISNNSGVVVARYDFDPYGRMTKLSGTYDTTFGFTGHYVHLPTGLALPLHRAYAADLGRWTSEDPAGLIDGVNLYRYVRGNPVSFFDPSGEMTSMQLACLTGVVFLTTVVVVTVTVTTGGTGTAALAAMAAGGAAGNAAAAAGTASIMLFCPPPVTMCPTRFTPLPPPWPPEQDERCRKAKQECIEECTELLPTGTWSGDPFFKCLRDCMVRKGCGI
jgi:RHS repeat-associated protein